MATRSAVAWALVGILEQDCHTHEDIADAAGWTSVQTVRQGRLDSSSASYSHPPDGWEPTIARLARERAAELVKLAEELEG